MEQKASTTQVFLFYEKIMPLSIIRIEISSKKLGAAQSPMFKKSFLFAVAILSLVFASALAGQLWMTRNLPSSYDTGLSIGQAFKTSKTPLLIEFYSDTCGACQRIAPWVHHLSETNFKGRLTPVMLNVDEPEVLSVAKLFGVQSLPALYVFDHKHMKKHAIAPEQSVSEATLKKTIDSLLLKTQSVAVLPR
jgi:thiol-disulfide isomerase/thioredoxin